MQAIRSALNRAYGIDKGLSFWRARLKVTLFTIVVTGNHFWFDGIGGLLALAFGFLVGNTGHKWNQRRLDAKFEEARSHHPSQSAAH